MKNIDIGSLVKLPKYKGSKHNDEYKVFSILYYGDYSSFDAKKEIPFNTSLWNKIKWLFTSKPIYLKKQIGVRMKKEIK